MRALSLTATLFFSTVSAVAQTCTATSPTINLTTGSGSLARLPALDQGNTGLCYAFTISQLVDAQRYRDPAARGRISPLSTGMLTPQLSQPLTRSRLTDGGSIRGAFDTLYTPGNPVCEHGRIERLYGDADDQYSYFGTVELMYKGIREAHYAICGCTPGQRRETARNRVGQLSEWVNNEELLVGSPQASTRDLISDLGEVVLRLNDLPPASFGNYNASINQRLLVPLFSRICHQHTVRVPSLSLRGMRDPRHDTTSDLTPASGANPTQALSNYAWNLLARPGAQPVGITFCSAMLTGESSFISPAIGHERCGTHAAVLAGVRCVNGQRQFLLRNSWGPDCGEDLAARHRPNCDGRGNLWVNGSSLMGSTYSLYQTVP